MEERVGWGIKDGRELEERELGGWVGYSKLGREGRGEGV